MGSELWALRLKNCPSQAQLPLLLCWEQSTGAAEAGQETRRSALLKWYFLKDAVHLNQWNPALNHWVPPGAFCRKNTLLSDCEHRTQRDVQYCTSPIPTWSPFAPNRVGLYARKTWSPLCLGLTPTSTFISYPHPNQYPWSNLPRSHRVKSRDNIFLYTPILMWSEQHQWLLDILNNDNPSLTSPISSWRTTWMLKLPLPSRRGNKKQMRGEGEDRNHDVTEGINFHPNSHECELLFLKLKVIMNQSICAFMGS